MPSDCVLCESVPVEPRFRGIKIQDLGPYNWHTGSMQIGWRAAETGERQGVTDPRRLGLAKGF